MSSLFVPEDYQPVLALKQTELAIKEIKDFFEVNLSSELNLSRVTPPLFVKKGFGINDDLTGIEKPVAFRVKDMASTEVEIVQSLAKWKRMVLADYDIPHGYGIYADMNAVRPDEVLDNTHSLYVDQWDWERVISPEERGLDFLKRVVRKIYHVLKRTEFYICERYPRIVSELPEEIVFIHSEDLQREFPGLTPREREDRAAKKYRAVFVIGIGAALGDGKPHDSRAPDYDDWTTPTVNGYRGLNGDIILWNPVLRSAFEISSMGIRVDRDALLRQLQMTGTEERKKLLWHSRLLAGELPLSIGGGIGQSRICMYYLRKAHVGETQSSIWPEETIEKCRANHMFLL